MKRCFFIFLLILCLLPCLAGAVDDDALYPIRENDLWGYMNRQGETVIAPQWKTAREFSGDTAIVSLNALPMDSSWSMEGHCDGLIDRQGRYVIEPAPDQDIEEYRYAYRVRLYDDAYDEIEGFYDKASGFYQPPVPEYTFVMLWGEDGKGPIAVANSDGLTGYVDRTTGETVIPFRYTGDSDDVCFYGGYARPADEIIVEDAVGHELAMGMHMHLIDAQGNEITFDSGITLHSGVYDGCAVYSMRLPAPETETEEEPDDGDAYLRNGEKIVPPYYLVDAVTGERTEYPDYESSWGKEAAVGWGIAKIDGTILSGPDTSLWYVWEPDAEDMLCILSDDGSGSLCGHMDLTGRVIVPPKYRIDKGGAIPYYYFRNGYAVIDDLGENWQETERYVIIDTEGNEVFFRSAVADSFSLDVFAEVLENGLIWYQENGLYGLMKITGDGAEYVTEPRYESHVGGVFNKEDLEYQIDFAEGLHPVKLGGLWGYINEQAETVIPPAWDKASSFRDGLALVEKDGKLAYIDHAGIVVWQEAPMVYYNANGGKYYHADPCCPRVDPTYWPLSPVLFDKINEGKFLNLLPCSICGAPERPSVDDAQ